MVNVFQLEQVERLMDGPEENAVFDFLYDSVERLQMTRETFHAALTLMLERVEEVTISEVLYVDLRPLSTAAGIVPDFVATVPRNMN